MNSGAATPVPNLTHEPPSLPTSPHPKRTKPTEVRTREAEFVESGRATPTPIAMASHTLQQAATLPPAESLVATATPPPLQVQLLSSKGRPPTRGSEFAAGYDIYSSEDTSVPARGKAMVATDIAIAVPPGTYGRVAPRSGLAAKHSIDVGAGVIDADYRGQVKVILFNYSDQDFTIREGDRIAQLIIERIYTPDVLVVERLEESVRGAGGFGSTGGFSGATAAVVRALNGPSS